jgi:hypothetical protein
MRDPLMAFFCELSASLTRSTTNDGIDPLM